MDIERIKRYTKQKVKAGNAITSVRDVIKNSEHLKQDQYEGVSETYKPLLDKQDLVKKTIDKKQDQLINQLQNNQLAITQGLDNILESNNRAITFDTVLPKAIEGVKEEEERKEKGPTILNIDNAFGKDDRIILNNHKLLKPKDLTQVSPERLLEEKKKAVEIARKIGNIKGQKKTSEEDKKSYDVELETLKKYRESIKDLITSYKYMKKGEGIKYNQPKRNAYKISSTGQYGNLKIDLPKLIGQLKLVAYKNGQKLYDKIVDFDTVDLLSKRFNSKKRYSDLSQKVFNELNQLSEIPIHKTSKK